MTWASSKAVVKLSNESARRSTWPPNINNNNNNNSYIFGHVRFSAWKERFKGSFGLKRCIKRNEIQVTNDTKKVINPAIYLYTLSETNSSPLKIGRAPKGNFILQPSIFRGYVSFRKGTENGFFVNFWTRFFDVDVDGSGIRRSPVDMVFISHYLRRVSYMLGG